jgi:hypothetical protein
MEFFLAKEANENPKFLSSFNFTGMDMAKKFYEELNPYIKHFEAFPGKVKNFICTNTMGESQYTNGLFQSIPFSNHKKICTLPEAMTYCNELNQKYGYPKIYQIDLNNSIKPYSFLNFQEKIVNDVSKLRGFRLPTSSEWETIAKIAYEDMITGNENVYPKVVNFEFVSGFNEWLFDETGYYIKKLDFKERLESTGGGTINVSVVSLKISVDVNKTLKTKIDTDSKLVVLNTPIATIKETSQLKVGFRVIFVP